MNTKEKIIWAALELFNSKGLKEVTVRTICKELNISPGNFSYYFSNKDIVVVELYKKMISELYEMSAYVETKQPSITDFLNAHHRYFEIQLKYKFFFLNFFEIITHYSAIKNIYMEIHEKERIFAKESLIKYMDKGVLISSISNEDLDNIINVGFILNNFWMVDSLIHQFPSKSKMKRHYLLLCCGRLLPYPTSKARSEFEQYFENL